MKFANNDYDKNKYKLTLIRGIVPCTVCGEHCSFLIEGTGINICSTECYDGTYKQKQMKKDIDAHRELEKYKALGTLKEFAELKKHFIDEIINR